MPDEPNKKMDDMLRAYAEERRKAANLELHPATRNLLQGEVTRVFGRPPESRSWWNRLRAFWPQIAFGGSLCMILGIAVLSLRQPPPTEQKNAPGSSVGRTVNDASESHTRAANGVTAQGREESSIAAEADRPAIEAAGPREDRGIEPATRAVESRERSFNRTLPRETAAASSRPQSVLRQKESAPADGRTTELADAISPAEREPLTKKTEAVQRNPAAATRSATKPAAPAPSPADPRGVSALAAVANPVLPSPEMSRAAELTNLGAARRLNFVQLSATNSRAGAVVPATTPVLATFQVEQFGTNVRFLDRDGSVYVGAFEPAAAFATLERKDDAAQNAGQAHYSFRVQGTNLSLGTDLLFTGQYFEPTNRAPSSLDTFAIAPGAAPRPTNQDRHLIIGNATIGATNQLPVRAISSGP